MTISTAISDALLAAAALGGAGVLQVAALKRSSTAGTERLTPKALGYYLSVGSLGVGLVGLAALTGTVRFAGVEEVVPAHEFLSRLAGMTGVPMVGLAYVGFSARLPTVWVTGVAAGLTLLGVLVDVRLVRTGLGAVAMLAVLGACLPTLARRPGARLAGMMGAVLTLVTGLAIGTKGELFGFPRLDWFHVGLAIADALLVAGLLWFEPKGGGPSEPSGGA